MRTQSFYIILTTSNLIWLHQNLVEPNGLGSITLGKQARLTVTPAQAKYMCRQKQLERGCVRAAATQCTKKPWLRLKVLIVNIHIGTITGSINAKRHRICLLPPK